MMAIADVEKLLPKIREGLEEAFEILQKEANGNGDWTRGVLNAMNRLAEKLSDDLGKGIQVCPNKMSPKGAGEWLLDLIWYRMTDDDEHLREIVLAMESEWSHYTWDVKYDFEKLLVVRAPIKILIAEKYHGDVLSMVEGELKSYADSGIGETYLIALYKDGEFSYHCYRIIAPGQWEIPANFRNK